MLNQIKRKINQFVLYNFTYICCIVVPLFMKPHIVPVLKFKSTKQDMSNFTLTIMFYVTQVFKKKRKSISLM